MARSEPRPLDRAWLLANVGAEERRPLPSQAARGVAALVAELWGLLFASPSRFLPQGEQVSWPAVLKPAPAAAFDWIEDRGGGVAWLATETARLDIERRGLRWSGPDPAVVQRVHDKAFALEASRRSGHEPKLLAPLVAVLDPAHLVAADAADGILDRVATWPAWVGDCFVLKPRKGTSGRGRLAGPRGCRDGMTTAALGRLAGRGGALLEPWLERRADFSVQLHIGPEGGVTILGTTRQRLTPAGVYVGNEGLLDARGRATSGSSHDDEIRAAAQVIGAAAAAAGFRGPCGIDSFTFAGPGGEVHLRPVVELNARYTMGTIALGVMERLRQSGESRGVAAWSFTLARHNPVAPPPGEHAILLGEVPGIQAILSLAGDGN